MVILCHLLKQICYTIVDRQIFTIGKITKIAGCYVTEGKINRNDTATIYREGVEIFKGSVDQLKRFKDDVKEVAQGFECGISFIKFNDIQSLSLPRVAIFKDIHAKEHALPPAAGYDTEGAHSGRGSFLVQMNTVLIRSWFVHSSRLSCK